MIELDAWNLRERDGWGQSEALRRAGQEPARWHWAYGGTCFRLSQRGQTAGGRPVILSRGFVMTRGGLEALREQLWAEAMRHGLGKARAVLIVADGAVWIWKLASDRFPEARQRLDYYHASEHLWAVARALHPKDEAAARAWVAPLLEKLKAGDGVEVIENLESLLKRLRGGRREAVQSGANYLQSHRDRLDYDVARRRGEPLGSGAMESTCRQYQCRFSSPKQSLLGGLIIQYPKILEFTSGDWSYATYHGGVVLRDNVTGVKQTVWAGEPGHEILGDFKSNLASDPNLKANLVLVLTDEVSVFNNALRVQIFAGGAMIFETKTGITSTSTAIHRLIKGNA